MLGIGLIVVDFIVILVNLVVLVGFVLVVKRVKF